MALFNGGTRGASLVAIKQGFLAVFQFEELARLRQAKDEMQRAVARKLNGQLAQSVPWSVDSNSLDSPHTKAFLLLQAHLVRL